MALTRDKVKHSPSIDADKPVSRLHERDYYRYYGYPYYWGYSDPGGMGAYPAVLAAGRWNDSPGERTDETGDVHLRSASELRGYHIQGSDEAIGHVEDFIVDDETWQVRYLVIDTSNWWFGKKVLVAPHWASRISWEERKVHVDLSRQAIKNSPEWNASTAVKRENEARLYDYYGRPVYWGSGDQPAGKPSVDQSASHPGNEEDALGACLSLTQPTGSAEEAAFSRGCRVNRDSCARAGAGFARGRFWPARVGSERIV